MHLRLKSTSFFRQSTRRLWRTRWYSFWRTRRSVSWTYWI